MRMQFWVLLFALVSILIFSCQSVDLGSHIFLMRGDRAEDGIMVICDKGKSYGACVAGSYLIPQNYNAHFDSTGRYREYVRKYAANKNYVLAATFLIGTKKNRYWIVEKKQNLEVRVLGPFEEDAFSKEKQRRNIDLQLQPAW